MEKKLTNLLWVVVGLVAVMAAVSIILSFVYRGGYTSSYYGPFGMMGYGYYGMGWIMPVIGAVSIIFVIVFVFFVIDAARGNDRASASTYGKTPEDIARERFARGEISEEEFGKIIENLRR